MVSSVKDGGSNQALWPTGVDKVEDLPHDLSIAIEQAYKVLSWQENLDSDEIPPQWMWHLDWELEDWFVKVRNDREAKYGGNKDESPELEENEYAARFK